MKVIDTEKMICFNDSALTWELLSSQAQKPSMELVQKLLKAYSLLLLPKRTGEEYIINIHQTSSNCEEISELIKESKSPEIQYLMRMKIDVQHKN